MQTGEATAMSAAEKLLAIEEIKQLKARYFRFVDTKQWRQFGELFTVDVVVDFSDDNRGQAPIRGREELRAIVERLLGTCLSLHHGHTPEIEILSATKARGIWVMQDWLNWPKDKEAPLGYHTLVGWGHYHETYVKSHEGWQIATLKLTRMRLDRDSGGSDG
jgi:hypothetical protein